MARDKGNFYEASDWFKEALQINQVSGIDLVSEISFYPSKSVCLMAVMFPVTVASLGLVACFIFISLVKDFKEYNSLFD